MQVINPFGTQWVPNEKKLAAMILFFLEQGQSHLGKTKLMKLLYFADFKHYREFDRPISCVTYLKFPQGPVPNSGKDVLRKLEACGAIERQNVPTGNFVMHTHCVRDVGLADIDELEGTELEVVMSVWDKWKSASTTEIVEASHQELGWQSAELWASIPYHTALFG